MSSSETVLAKLEAARRELLDLSGRNRLLNTSRSRTRTSRLDIVDERSEEVFRHLVSEGRAMQFLPSVEPPELLERLAAADDQVDPSTDARNQPPTIEFESSDDDPDFAAVEPTDGPALAQPEDDGEPETDDGASPQHVDDRLQTELSSEQLQKRLLKLFYDARTYEEEQGVNLLFLVLGFLRWVDVERDNRVRYAPLILVPAQLKRRSAGSRFKVSYDGEEITTNLSLQEKLKVDFGLTLPSVEDSDEFLSLIHI